MRICICDDDVTVHGDIKALLSKFFTQTDMPDITDLFSGDELIRKYDSNEKFDIIFLDVEMEGKNGIETASEIRKNSVDAIIVFVSSHKNYVFEAFRCEAFHFIVKPIDVDEFDDVFRRAIHKFNNMNNKYPVSWRGRVDILTVGEITHIEGYHRHLKVYANGSVYEHIGKITDAYEHLKPHGFVMVHQGFLVNMSFIKSFGGNEIVLLDGTKIVISSRKRHEAMLIYDNYIQNWKW